jgi:hypothetical protein
LKNKEEEEEEEEEEEKKPWAQNNDYIIWPLRRIKHFAQWVGGQWKNGAGELGEIHFPRQCIYFLVKSNLESLRGGRFAPRQSEKYRNNGNSNYSCPINFRLSGARSGVHICPRGAY